MTSFGTSFGPPPPPPPRHLPPRAGRSRPRRWLRRVLWAGVFAGGLYLGVAFIFGLLVGGGPVIHDGAWIEIRFTSDYPESRPNRTGLEGALGRTQLSATDLRYALESAMRDPRIEGLLVRPDGFPGSWAQVEELLHALDRWRESGRKSVAYLDFPSSRAYAIALGADDILLAPEGMLATVGLEARLTYLAGSLQKLGADPDFVAIGDYKSAPEQFERVDPSSASREQTETLLDDVWTWWLGQVAMRRGLEVSAVEGNVDRSPLDAIQAVESGFVDRAIDFGDWCLEVGLHPDRDFFDPLAYLSAATEDHREHQIAVVYVDGSIAPGTHGNDPVWGRIAGSETVVERLRMAKEDDGVEAVVVRVDSPGGAASASHAIYRELCRLRETKPVVVSMAGTAASGGYYLSLGANAILADSNTVTGSIGVFSGKLVLSELYDKVGITHTTLRRGRNAGIFDDLEAFDPAQRSQIRGQLEAFYDRFLAKVAENRGLDLEAVERSAGGRVWSGARAQSLGLVDAIGDFSAAVSEAEALAGLAPRSSRIIDYQPRPGFYEQILSELLGPSTRLARSFAAVQAWLSWTAGTPAALDGAVQYRLPWDWQLR